MRPDYVHYVVRYPDGTLSEPLADLGEVREVCSRTTITETYRVELTRVRHDKEHP